MGINETLRHFDTWNMDMQPLVQLVDDKGIALPIVFLQCVLRRDLQQSLHLDFELLFNISQHVEAVSNEYLRFNTPAQLCVSVHSAYYLVNNMFEKLIDDFEMFAVFFTLMISKYQHPGLTNEFLVKTRHGRALRYNDSSVQESYVCAQVTKLLRDPEYNFLLLLEEIHVEAFRKLIISLVLKLDIAKHFDFLSRLQTKLASDRYPSTLTWLAFVTKYNRARRATKAMIASRSSSRYYGAPISPGRARRRRCHRVGQTNLQRSSSRRATSRSRWVYRSRQHPTVT